MVEHKPLSTLAEEFSAVADKWVNGPVVASALVTRYALLMRHCAESDEQKGRLTETLFNASVSMLEKPLNFGPTQGLNPAYKNHMAIVLDMLAHESAIRSLPVRAPRVLADVALAILDHAEKSKVSAEDKIPFHEYAAMLLGYADTFAAAITARSYETATSQPIAAARTITLKQKTASPE